MITSKAIRHAQPSCKPASRTRLASSGITSRGSTRSRRKPASSARRSPNPQQRLRPRGASHRSRTARTAPPRGIATTMTSLTRAVARSRELSTSPGTRSSGTAVRMNPQLTIISDCPRNSASARANGTKRAQPNVRPTPSKTGTLPLSGSARGTATMARPNSTDP